jgi:predicted nuclease of predicted toxin-antitoxin system
MRLCLDEDISSRELVQMLTKAGHHVATPLDVDLMGDSDTLQITHAVRDDRVCLTKNADDFEALHNLIVLSGGSHPGVLTVRSNNNARRDMKPRQIVNAIKNVFAVVSTLRNHVFCLNDWR